MSDSRRDTFKQIAQIIAEATDHMDAVAGTMGSLKVKDPDEHFTLLLNVYVSEQKAAVSKMRQYIEDMDKSSAEEYVQYKLDVDPDDLAELPSPIDGDALTQWLLGENNRVMALLKELAENVSADEARDSINGLVQLLDGLDRRIARESRDTGDI